MSDQRTRHSQRSKKFAPLVKTIDPRVKDARCQAYIDALESDYYDSPNKLAEDEQSDDFDANEEGDTTRKKLRKQKKKKIPKKAKVSAQIRRNLNLRKMIKDERQEVGVFANFVSVSANPSNIKSRAFCSICGILGKYHCPRCSQSYCSASCNQAHKEIQCLRADF